MPDNKIRHILIRGKKKFMKRLKRTLCILLAVVLTLTSVTLLPVSAETDGDAVITVPITVQEEYDMAQEFFEILNKNRADAGKYEYILDDRLMDLAMDRAAQCCIYFGHNSLVYSNYDGMSGTYIDKYGKHSTDIFMQEDIAEGLADARVLIRYGITLMGTDLCLPIPKTINTVVSA